MNFLIADTFSGSLVKLAGDEQKQVKTTAFDLQMNIANPGMSFHKLDRARDKNFWSVRVSSDIRIIVHKTESSLLLCYVDHHDRAYHWAERRKLEIHPTTGAAQLVEVRETVQEIRIPTYLPGEVVKTVKPALFAGVEEDALLAYGVPLEWLADVRAADEDSLLQLAEHLPSEAAEALLELATGGRPPLPVVAVPGVDPFKHPDAQRRFRVMADAEELAKALDYPWEKWAVFLHPIQRQLVEKDYNGPARVAGSAGTGKTIVALHRAVYLARSNPDSRVLLTTFSTALANALHFKLKHLIGNQPRLAERLEVVALDELARRLFVAQNGPVKIASDENIDFLLKGILESTTDIKFSRRFLLGEWEDVVDAWQLNSWEEYRDIKRLGRKTRLPEGQREALWDIFARLKDALKKSGLMTRSEIFTRVTSMIGLRRNPLFDYAIVDEAQDLSVSQLRFLAELAGGRSNGLFFAGDLGQRIFQTPFSWKSLGVDVRGRSQTLRINYRTSHQIRLQADRLLGPEISDVDGNTEDHRGTVSVFNGPSPEIRRYDSEDAEQGNVASWLTDRLKEGVNHDEIGIFVRSEVEMFRAIAAVEHAGLPYSVLDENLTILPASLTISTMHLAKGLEFRIVVVMACDDEVIPSQVRIESITDQADLEEVYETERHLLYVACTRARDHLLITCVNPGSEFLDDML
jgi:mRNA-degrading endonuclease RelE of RelBE toxin-antitoxin system